MVGLYSKNNNNRAAAVLLLLFILSHPVVVAAAANGHGKNHDGFLHWFKLFWKNPSPPPPPPPTLADKAVKEMEWRRAALEREAKKVTREVNEAARRTGSEYKDAALKQAREKQKGVEAEVQRLSKEVDRCA